MVRTCRSGGLARRGRCSGGQAQRGRGDVGPVVWLGVAAPRTGGDGGVAAPRTRTRSGGFFIFLINY